VGCLQRDIRMRLTFTQYFSGVQVDVSTGAVPASYASYAGYASYAPCEERAIAGQRSSYSPIP
jgi:hypothetical protein